MLVRKRLLSIFLKTGKHFIDRAPGDLLVTTDGMSEKKKKRTKGGSSNKSEKRLKQKQHNKMKHYLQNAPFTYRNNK